MLDLFALSLEPFALKPKPGTTGTRDISFIAMPNLLSTKHGRRVLFTALYLSEGAPIGFIWWALPTKLRAAGIDLGTITSVTSLLVLPWVFKFLWAPLIDGIRTPRWTLRSWILSTQLLMGCSLIPMLFYELATNLSLLVPFLLLSAIAGATQDASIDALAISTVPARERGSVNGWMQFGMLLGRSALGGGALLLDQRVGMTAVVVILIGVIWSSSVLVLFATRVSTSPGQGGGIRMRMRALFPRLAMACRSRTTWYGLLFAGIAGAGFEGVGAVAGPFLIDRGLTQAEIGRFFAVPSVVAMAGGALLGGFLADRFGTRRAVAVFLSLMSVTIVALAAMTMRSANQAGLELLALMTLLYVCIGLFTASSYALFMEITDPALGATQFSAFMGATNGCESWSGFFVGKAAPSIGYSYAFLLLMVVSLMTLPLLRRMQSAESQHDRESIGLWPPDRI
jgi:PAT family beta-lactamase induction signal transducer AmpG